MRSTFQASIIILGLMYQYIFPEDIRLHGDAVMRTAVAGVTADRLSSTDWTPGTPL